MFRKSSADTQLSLFSSPSSLLCERERREYEDPLSWHNKFFEQVTSKIDEEVFSVLFSSGNEDGKDGRPNAAVRQLVAMNILKEGSGCSDEKLYEDCRFNLLYRQALGLVNLDDRLPSLSTYYGFRKALCLYQEEKGVDLFDKCFKNLTGLQAKEYRVSGRCMRMDSKLIGSNIAWYSRYEIIHCAFVRECDESDVAAITDQAVRQHASEFLGEDAARTVYTTASEQMGVRLLLLGIVIDHILGNTPSEMKALLRRVFDEQYEKAEDGTVSVRDKKKISAGSVQNPNDPDAEYRCKNGKKVKGYSVNITETTDQEGDAPNLVTDVRVEGATASDNDFLEQAVVGSGEVTGDRVERVHADGAYQSPGNRALASDEKKGFEFVANGIQGRRGRFDLYLGADGELTVTDTYTDETFTAERHADNVWKIRVSKDGRSTWRYFTAEQAEKSEVRRQVESIPFEKRKKRNNVEASIFQYCFHTRDNKTRYRGRLKHKIQALARCAWINMRRLLIFDTRMALRTV